MNMHKSLMLFLAIAANTAIGQGTVIGPSIRNGGFENGVFTPWFGDYSVVQDSQFASEGSWFASVQSSNVLSPQAIQNMLLDPNGGLSFLLTFDARVGATGYNLLSTRMSARTESSGAPLSAIVTTLLSPTLTASDWQTYQFKLQMSEPWNNRGVTFSIYFNNDQPLGGITHVGYLDNVVLQQIPEPSALALLCCGGFLLAARRFCVRSR